MDVLQSRAQTLELLLAEREARLTEKDILIAELRSSLRHEREASKGLKPMTLSMTLNIASSVLLTVIWAGIQYELTHNAYLLGAAITCIIFGVISFAILYVPARGIVQQWREAHQISGLVRHFYQLGVSISVLVGTFTQACFLHLDRPWLVGGLLVGTSGCIYNILRMLAVSRERVGAPVGFQQVIRLLTADFTADKQIKQNRKWK